MSLPQVVLIEGVDGLVFEQDVVYEWIPPYCDKCNKVGHCYKPFVQKKQTEKWVPKNSMKESKNNTQEAILPVSEEKVVDNNVHSVEEEGEWTVVRKKKEKKLFEGGYC